MSLIKAGSEAGHSLPPDAPSTDTALKMQLSVLQPCCHQQLLLQSSLFQQCNSRNSTLGGDAAGWSGSRYIPGPRKPGPYFLLSTLSNSTTAPAAEASHILQHIPPVAPTSFCLRDKFLSAMLRPQLKVVFTVPLSFHHLSFRSCSCTSAVCASDNVLMLSQVFM